MHSYIHNQKRWTRILIHTYIIYGAHFNFNIKTPTNRFPIQQTNNQIFTR